MRRSSNSFGRLLAAMSTSCSAASASDLRKAPCSRIMWHVSTCQYPSIPASHPCSQVLCSITSRLSWPPPSCVMCCPKRRRPLNKRLHGANNVCARRFASAASPSAVPLFSKRMRTHCPDSVCASIQRVFTTDYKTFNPDAAYDTYFHSDESGKYLASQINELVITNNKNLRHCLVRSWDDENKVVKNDVCPIAIYSYVEGNDDEWIGLGKTGEETVYFVKGADVRHKVLVINGTVHLVLSDNTTLSCAHIKLEHDKGATLYIHNEDDSDNEGKLIVKNVDIYPNAACTVFDVATVNVEDRAAKFMNRYTNCIVIEPCEHQDSDVECTIIDFDTHLFHCKATGILIRLSNFCPLFCVFASTEGAISRKTSNKFGFSTT